jgi:hypothetical protein
MDDREFLEKIGVSLHTDEKKERKETLTMLGIGLLLLGMLVGSIYLFSTNYSEGAEIGAIVGLLM